eukprot:m51a1_g13102 hypothetical protein (333) ;mRNA; r:61-1810
MSELKPESLRKSSKGPSFSSKDKKEVLLARIDLVTEQRDAAAKERDEALAARDAALKERDAASTDLDKTLERVEAERQALKDLFASTLERKFSEETGMPATATVMIAYLSQTCAWVKLDDRSMSSVDAILSISHGWNNALIAHWMSAAWWLVREARSRLTPQAFLATLTETEFVMRPLPEKAPPKRRVPSEGEMSPGARKLTRLFQTFLFDMFNTAFEHAVRSLEPLLVPYIIERQPARAASPAGGPIEAVLSAALQDLRTARVCDAVCLQFFSQVVSYINTILLNTLLKSSHHCTCGTGIQVKLAISRIEEWLQREPAIAPARTRPRRTRP